MRFRVLLLTALAGGLLALAAPAPAQANVCLVGPKSTGTLAVLGQDKSNPPSYQPGQSIEDCTGTVRADGGNVDLCLPNKLGQFSCKPLKPGDQVEVEELADRAQWVSILQVIHDFLHGAPEHVPGMKRLRDTNAPPEGLPEGAVLMPPQSLEFSAPRAGLEGIDRLTVALKDGPGTPLFTTAAPAATVAVPRDVLAPGGAYRWKLTDGGETLEGGFTVAEAEDQRDFEEELAGLLDGSGPDPSTRNLVRAVLAKQYGYTYDMFLALEAARDSASMPDPPAVLGARPDGETMP